MYVNDKKTFNSNDVNGLLIVFVPSLPQQRKRGVLICTICAFFAARVRGSVTTGGMVDLTN